MPSRAAASPAPRPLPPTPPSPCPAASAAPSNTLDAVLNLFRNPAANVAGLYTLSAGVSTFTPALSAAPSDWTLFINYTGGGMNAPSGLGVDGTGNIWVANYFNVA